MFSRCISDATVYCWTVSGFVPCSLLPYHFAQWDDTAKFAYSLLVVGSAVAGLVVCYFGAAKTPWAYLLEMDSCFSIPQAQAISTAKLQLPLRLFVFASPLLDEVNADFSSAVDLMDPIWSDIACLRSFIVCRFCRLRGVLDLPWRRWHLQTALCQELRLCFSIFQRHVTP